jgi:hypothetical protein
MSSPPRAATPEALFLDEARMQFLAREGAAWLANHAGLMGLPRASDDKRAQYMHVPFSLVPMQACPRACARGGRAHERLSGACVQLPRREFESIVAVAPVFNTIVDSVSRDEAYLRHVLRRCAACPVAHEL